MTDAAEAIERFLSHNDIPFKRVGDAQWAAQMRGERKLTIPVMITLTGDRLDLESFFMRRPQDNLAHFYELLLRRNMRSYGVAFALDGVGDVYLVCSRSAAGLDEEELDRLFGALLIEADGMFNAAIEVGFEQYLELDRAWRARNPTG